MTRPRTSVTGLCGALAAVLLAGSPPASGQTLPWPGDIKPAPPAASTERPGSRPAASRPTPASATDQRRALLAGVRSWAFQLRLLRFPEIAASPLDLVVIDHALSAGRRFVHQFAPELIDAAKQKPDGSRRLVIAYLSIGEAERYRFYWDQAWYDPARKPPWLGNVNPVWDGNFLARFWHPDWQRIILDGPQSYLGRIQAAGFDGIYLDRSDVYYEWSREKPDAEAEMATFIQRIAAAARKSDPRFLIIMQNAEELVARKPVLEAIDAIAKEDLFYGIDHKASPNEAGTVADSLKYLRQAKRAGRRILVVEYLDDLQKVIDARRRIEAEGFLAHFTRRDLGDLMVTPPDRLQPVPTTGR